MDKDLEKTREEIIATVRLAVKEVGRVNSTVVLIDEQYLTYTQAVDVKNPQDSVQSIKNLKEEVKEILAFFYIDNIKIGDEIKIAIAESYIDGDFTINIFDINGRTLSINQVLTQQQTDQALQKEQQNNTQGDGFSFPMFGNWLN